MEALRNEEILFCHWKSNFALKDALTGDGDLDLLVHRKDAARFESIVTSLGFKQVIDPVQAATSAILHFYGFDHPTGALIHLHVYYRLITGESLLKNYCLPLEGLLLENTRLVEGIPVPQAAAELIVFVIRAMAKHSSVLECLLLWRLGRSSYAALRAELEALLRDGGTSRSSELLADWLPSVEPALFAECIDALRGNASLARRVWLAIRLRRELKSYERFSPASATLLRTTLLLRQIVRSLRGAGKSKRLPSGVVIALVGPEATGKSTLVREIANWLGGALDVTTVHLGKAPSTWLTLLPNLAVPLLRTLAPRYKTHSLQNASGSRQNSRASLLHSLRSVMNAWDRRALAAKARRKAAHGSIVICDRYPSAMVGAMDSARLRTIPEDSLVGRLCAYLARLEHGIYRQIAPPDTVIRLSVPVDVAIERNKKRHKKGKETDVYVWRRHTNGVLPSFPTTRTIELNTDQPQGQTIRSAYQVVWDSL